MIPHHHMVVIMSRMLVNHDSIEYEMLRPFSTQIASSQVNEIHQMQTWLYQWFDVSR